MRRWVRSDKGNILIMMAGAMAVLAGFGILTIDIGRMLVTRSQLQNAADAGALAGASLFCTGTEPTDAQVQDEVRLVGGSNKALQGAAVDIDIPNEQITIDRAANANDVTVRTESDTRQFLVGLFTIFQRMTPDMHDHAVPDPVREAPVAAIATARCGGTCSVSCVKPWTIPDRWDDITGVPGYMGERPLGEDWRNNRHWDSEVFTDVNNNNLYDLGEPYIDLNTDGQYNEEAYHPSLTGYGPDPVPGNYLSPDGDLGLELMLHADNGNTNRPEPGQYQSIDLPPVNKMDPPGSHPPTGGAEYRENIRTCNPASIEAGDWLRLKPGGMVGPTNQGMRDLIAQDPNASWDPTTQSVQGSNFPISPRIVLIPIHDPRIPIASGRNEVQVTKVAAFFMEQMIGPAEVRGRFLKVRAAGSTCPDGVTSGFFTYNLSLIR